MKLVLKIFKVLAIIVISITIILFSASFIFQDKVAGMILSSFNKNISTKIEFGSVRLSFLRKFPKASLHLKKVVVFSSNSFSKKSFSSVSVDTLLAAENISVEFKITDIIKGNYTIASIEAGDGNLNLFSDKLGMVNYDIEIKGNNSVGGGEVVINLDRIILKNIAVYYDNLAIDLRTKMSIRNGKIKSRISGNNIDFKASADISSELFILEGFSSPRSFLSEIDIDLTSTDSSTVIKKGQFSLGTSKFSVNGFVNYNKNYDFRLISDNLDLVNFKSYVPDKYLEVFSNYNTSGTLNINAFIKGLLSRTSTPEIGIDFGISNGSISITGIPFSLNQISLIGKFTNTPGPESGNARLLIKDIKGFFDKEEVHSSLLLTEFKPLSGELSFSGNIIPADIIKFFRIPHISSATGSVYVNATIKGAIPEREKLNPHDFLSLESDILLSFNSFGINLDNKIEVNNITGDLSISDSTFARDLTLTYKDQTFKINGWFVNLEKWLFGEAVQLKSSTSVICDKLYPETFLQKTEDGEPGQAFNFPGDVLLDLNVKINEFKYKTFSAENVSAILSYKPKLLNVNNLILTSLNGSISGNGLIVQNRDKSTIWKGTFKTKDIDINSAFKTFKNFGQEFIVAENLSGNLSGDLSILIPCDSLFNPQIKSITAEGKYIIANGTLKNFEPVKALSTFIELSELENISFDRLENDFFIRNNYLYTPQMDVKSSAADLSVNGKHSFDNDYEYHIKVLLSELLSKKLLKPKPNTTEFGAVKDDGLGRTSLLLKVEDKGDDVKVSYDVKAAGNQIKNSIKSERQNLKSILNEEYRLFKNDTTAKQKAPVNSTPRFRISWEEADSTNTGKIEPDVKKESPIKNIFRKK